ncbi:MAG: hypothetical protein ACHQ1G_12320, partial [Planctomycetota bacterium]
TPPPPAPDSAELKRKRAEAQAKVEQAEKTLKDLEAKHAQEKKGLPEAAPLRRAYVQAIRDAGSKASELKGLEERFAELKKLAESASSGKLKELRAEHAKIKERYDAIDDAWKKSREDVATGTVEETPVKRDLDTIRAVKQQWFAATPLARRGTAKEAERKIINDGFRGWLAEVPDRKRVVGDVLAQPLGPKEARPDSYDFTDLDFFILLQLRQEQLERQNVVVEKKELTESRGKLEEIKKELDAVDDKIRAQMLEGGEDLQEYEELLDRLPTVQKLASDLATRVGALSESLKQVDALKERQEREANELDAALVAAKKELAALRG